ncbi:MAG: MFS transporter [Halieaceae bacterium]|jgi:predicted MFS family arabinose efflux permease|nr:MFS transporter [Halieaceae bacterium]MBT4853667.1 MFS transporter [Halieaceae bacterium]MBT6265930.1 MFS transporter [Halieaceae bacterium]
MTVASQTDQDRKDHRYRWLVLVVLTIVYTFNFIDRQILVILQEPIKAELGLSDAQLGVLTGFSFALIYVCAGIPIAWLADRSNRRNIIAGSLALWSGMTALSGMVGSYSQLVLARLGVGLGEAGGSPPAHSMISDYFPPEKRGTALSFYTAGIYLGILFGFAGGGYIAETYGWRNAFFIVGIPGLFFALIVLLLVREPLRGRWDLGQSAAKSSLNETISTLRQRQAFWWIAFGCAMTSFVAYGNGNFYPSYLMRTHGFTVAEVGFALGLVSGVAGAIGTFMGGYLADRWGQDDKRWYVWIPIIGNCLAIVPMTFAILSDNATLVLLVLFPANILNSLYLGPSIAMCQSLVSPAMRAMASAVLFFILNMIGLGLGPVIVGILSDSFASVFGANNLRYAMLCALTLGLSGTGCFIMAARSLMADLKKQTG